MTFNQLYHFQTVAKYENYRKAAEELYISQPSLSRSIAALEEELQVPLFEKSGRGVHLTKGGHIFLEYVDRILEECRVAKSKMQEIASGGGKIDIGYVFPLASHYIPFSKVEQVFENTNRTFEPVDPELIDRIYSAREGVGIGELGGLQEKIVPNECFILKSDRNSVLARYNPFQKTVKRILKSKRFGIEPRNTEQTFALEVLTDPDIKLVSLTGKAGTGKTLLALAAALSQMSDYKQILLARPIIALSNKDLGYLPGNAQEKVAPYMQPLFDNLNVIRHQFSANSSELKKIEDLQKSGQLVIEALAFIRGRSLSETYCIIDEAQNLTPHEIKTIVTRAGEGTKIVFTGDLQQIDQPYLDAESSGLIYMINRMRGQALFAHINLVRGERSALAELASNLL